MIRRAYADLGIRQARYRLSLPGAGGKYVGSADMWQRATAVLTDVLDRCGVAYEAAEGEAAFYGPKIDVQVADNAGREATLSTVQVDFHQPEQFDLSYIGADGAKHRPVMVHRSIIGSVERAVAHLIELHGGAFPAWLAPTQMVILPVSDDAASTPCLPPRPSPASAPSSARAAPSCGTAMPGHSSRRQRLVARQEPAGPVGRSTYARCARSSPRCGAYRRSAVHGACPAASFAVNRLIGSAPGLACHGVS